jgi:cytochrome c biogenesis protein CcdA/thiol-disulfide isomerase/thioredoxin
MSKLYSIVKKSKVAYILPILAVGVSLFFSVKTPVYAQEDSQFRSFVYFTGIGCPHCAKVAPVLHNKVEAQNGLLMIEYEIYKDISNVKVMNDYGTALEKSFTSIPLVVYTPKTYDTGDVSIIANFDSKKNGIPFNTILILDQQVNWDDFNLNDLPGQPKLFYKNRALIKDDDTQLTDEQNNTLKDFLIADDLSTITPNLVGETVSSTSVEDSGGYEYYKNGIKIGGWTLLWEKTDTNENTQSGGSVNILAGISTFFSNIAEKIRGSFSASNNLWIKVFSLALADSFNPCALSVLLMMLIAIATYHPKDRKQVLWAGLAFVGAVFITYLLYGILIVKAFQFIQAISSIRLYLYKALGVGSILLGLLELKDYFFYKPGSAFTEMPLSFRPKVQKIMAKVTSPIGALGLGMFVTLFLLPCTMGPLFVTGGILSSDSLITALPYLLFYNLVFVLPMIVIILLVFWGSKSIKEITTWRENNVKVMHLIIGIIFVLLGLVMLLGLF